MKNKTSKDYKTGYYDACDTILNLIKRRKEKHVTWLFYAPGEPTVEDVILDIYELKGTRFIDEYDDDMFPEE